MGCVSLSIDGPIATLVLDRPDTGNALGLDGDGAEIREVCARLNADVSLRCVVLTGRGSVFCSGGDVRAMRDRTGAFAGGGLDIRDGYRRNIHEIVRALYGLELPLIAAVNGAAIGLGCDVACFADIRIASDRARFGVTFLKLGIIPGDGGAWLLPRIVGSAHAAKMLFTGEVITAERGAQIGLVSEVVSDVDLLPHTMQIASCIAQQPPQALRLCKALLRRGQAGDFETTMEMSAAFQALAHLTEDHREGLSALLERRTPDFQGR
jgi:2-(1,2-epoxy-1,2-dihydrophenyl)acetyl-CoA isomerase